MTNFDSRSSFDQRWSYGPSV